MGIRLERVRLVLSGVRLVGHHGQDEAEQRRGNRFRIDLWVEGKVGRSLQSDLLSDTVDYGGLVRVLRDVNRRRHHRLVESLAQEMAQALFGAFPAIDRLSIRVEKLAPPGLGRVRSAAVELIEERE